MRYLPVSAATMLLFCVATGANAAEYKVGSIEIDNPWSRATPKGAPTGAGYMKIKEYGYVARSLDWRHNGRRNGLSVSRNDNERRRFKDARNGAVECRHDRRCVPGLRTTQ